MYYPSLFGKQTLYHSKNIESICRNDGGFSYVLAKFPGSLHDSRICRLSQVGMYMENKFLVGEHIKR